VALRPELGLYNCLRPVRYFYGLASPVKHPRGVDMVILREHTEEIYPRIGSQQGSDNVKKFGDSRQTEMGRKNPHFPETSGLDGTPVSEEATQRLVRASINYALEQGRRNVTLVHKGNIMKFTEGSFKNWGYEVAEQEFGDKTFTWAEYDRIVEKEGKDAANKAQDEAEKAGKLIVK